MSVIDGTPKVKSSYLRQQVDLLVLPNQTFHALASVATCGERSYLRQQVDLLVLPNQTFHALASVATCGERRYEA